MVIAQFIFVIQMSRPVFQTVLDENVEMQALMEQALIQLYLSTLPFKEMMQNAKRTAMQTDAMTFATNQCNDSPKMANLIGGKCSVKVPKP